MIQLHHALITSLIALAGIVVLWLQRLYGVTNLEISLNSAIGGDLLLALAYLIAAVTSPVAALIIGVCGAVFAAYEHHIKIWLVMTGLVTFGVAASTILKGIIMLPRPQSAVLELGTYGFPSSHATVATIIFITSVWIAYHWRDLLYRRLIITMIGIGWMLIMLSRIWLQVHSLGDVLAGLLLGVAISSVSLAVMPRILAYYRITLGPDSN